MSQSMSQHEVCPPGVSQHDASRPENGGMRYLRRAEVVRAAREVDPVAVVRQALLLHAEGRTTLPEETCLAWQTAAGAYARSLALPGALWGAEPALGIKLINSSLANPDRGLRRAQGLLVLFDRETAHPIAIMEAAHLSALRTSAYTALSMQSLGQDLAKIAVIGCGALGEAHVRLLAGIYPNACFVTYDQVAQRCQAMTSALAADQVRCLAASSAQDAVRDAGVVITTTTTTTGYLPLSWLAPGALIAHVSLDDVMPDVVRLADLVIVDDWSLVSADDRRLLGRMHRSGALLGPGGEAFGANDTFGAQADARRVDGTLSDVLSGRHPGRGGPDQIVLSNPFGMGILDVALAAAVLGVCDQLGAGETLSIY